MKRLWWALSWWWYRNAAARRYARTAGRPTPGAAARRQALIDERKDTP